MKIHTMRNMMTAFLPLISLLMSGSIRSQVPTPGGVPLSILNGKYSMVFPEGSKNNPRVADIMAADPNINRETRVIYEKDKNKLVFFAQELYTLGGKKLFEEISAVKEPEFDFTRQILSDKDSLLVILSTPQKYDTSAAAILVNSAFILSPDQTISRIDAYISPGSFMNAAAYRDMSEQVFKSVSIGPRRIKLDSKEETYKIFGTGSSFLFALPKNYYVTVDEKYDFVVFKINKLKTGILDTTYSGISIYSGHHPNFFHSEYGYKLNQAEKSPGKFVQVPLDWIFFRDDSQSFYLKEQVLAADMIEKGLVFHIAMLTNKKEILDELKKIVESVKLIK